MLFDDIMKLPIEEQEKEGVFTKEKFLHIFRNHPKVETLRKGLEDWQRCFHFLDDEWRVAVHDNGVNKVPVIIC